MLVSKVVVAGDSFNLVYSDKGGSVVFILSQIIISASLGHLNSFEGAACDAGVILDNEPMIVVESGDEGPRDQRPGGWVAPLDPFQ